MTRSIRLRRALASALILTAILTLSPVSAANASTTREEARYVYTSDRICDIPWKDGAKQVKRLIRCSAHHWHVNVDKALAVANRESNFRPRAYNSWSCASGIYQHLCHYWPDRAYRFGFKGRSAFNGRANIIVTMKMVSRHGWSPWGG
jgi:soluble lytic murein transglycosylase-like protein